MGIKTWFENLMGDEEVDVDETEGAEMDLIVPPAEVAEPEVAERSERKRGNKVLNINATAQLQVVLVKPERFDDASVVADHLNANVPWFSTLNRRTKTCPAAFSTF